MPSIVSKICLFVATVASTQDSHPPKYDRRSDARERGWLKQCFIGYSGARVEELCGHDGVTCDETSCTSPYNVNYSPDAVGCKASDTWAVQDAIANGMFGLKDGQTRDCSAWCLWDLSTKGAAKQHYKWNNKKECWKRKRGSKCSGSQGTSEKVNALAHFEMQCQAPLMNSNNNPSGGSPINNGKSCSPRQGQEYCCDRGSVSYGDGSACVNLCSNDRCAMWGNAALDRCTDHQV